MTKKRFSTLRPSAILNFKNFNFWSRDCHRVQYHNKQCCSVPNFIKIGRFLSRVSILTRDIDIPILSVRHVPVFYGNGLTYCHSFFTTDAYLLLRVYAIDRCFYFPTLPISCGYFTLGNCQDLNISKN